MNGNRGEFINEEERERALTIFGRVKPMRRGNGDNKKSRENGSDRENRRLKVDTADVCENVMMGNRDGRGLGRNWTNSAQR